MTGRPEIDRAGTEDLTALVTDVGPAPMQVGAILVLDTSDGFDLSAARDAIDQRVRSIPRLRQCLQSAPLGCGRPFWVDDNGFDIGAHVSIDVDPPDGGLDAVLAVGADLVATRLSRDRPLWAARFVAADSATTALIVVFHHVLADGIGGLAVLAASSTEPLSRSFLAFLEPHRPVGNSPLTRSATAWGASRLSGSCRVAWRLRSASSEPRVARGRRDHR